MRPFRRNSARLILSAAVCLVYSLGLLTGGHVAASNQTASRPNVVLIYVDDLGYGDLSCLNPESKIQTPFIDRLAREGISFTDAHSPDSVCTPSRYGLLTGRYCWRTELKRGVLGAEHPCLITDDRLTLASLLKRRGYHTAMIGKWHLGMDFPGEPGRRDWTQPVRDMPLDKGFDYFWGIPASLNYGILAWFENRHAAVPPELFTAKKPNRIAISDYRIRPPYDGTPQATRQRLNKAGFEVAADFVDQDCLTRFTQQAVQYLKQQAAGDQSDKPFFLYLPYTSPHKPVIPLPQFRGRSQAGAYGDFVLETDHHVGAILQTLADLQLDASTMVIFTSDNGPENTWKQRIQKFDHDSRGGLRDGKRSAYEGGHRVPFLVRWPAGIAAPGRESAALVGQTDVVATLADLTEVDVSDDAAEDSYSFRKLLQQPGHQHRRPPMVHHAANGRFALRHQSWKLLLPHAEKPAELYDLRTDPAEQQDVAADHPEVVRELTDRLTQIITSGRSTPGASVSNDTGHWSDLAWLTEAEFDALVERERQNN